MPVDFKALIVVIAVLLVLLLAHFDLFLASLEVFEPHFDYRVKLC